MTRSPRLPLAAALLGLFLPGLLATFGGSALADTGRAPAAERAALERRIDDLIARMTLEEKVGQLNLVSRADDIGNQIEGVRQGRIGAILNVAHPADIRRFAEAARSSRLGIPLMIGLDAVSTFRIALPPPIAWAATWRPELAERAAEAVAREAAAVGINWTFAPMVDISRDPRWGRVIEGGGEDAFLAARLAAARVRGYRKGGVMTAVKHFVGYGAPEAGRDYAGAQISTSELFDRYLPPFVAALEAGSETVMSAFNAVNGIPVSADRRLLTDLLRGRLGFDGFVTSDYNSIGELTSHGIAADKATAGRKALLAGLDMDMEGAVYEAHLADEVRAGRIPIAAVDEAVRRVLRVKMRAGLFERPLPNDPVDMAKVDEAEVRRTARQVAREGFVLLKNDGALPITAAHKRVAVIGAAAENDYEGSWYGPAGQEKPDTVSILTALRQRAPKGVEITFAKGVEDVCARKPGDTAGAVRAANAADLVLVVVMEDCELSGEATSRADLSISGAQREVVDAVLATGKPVVLLLSTGRPLILTRESQKAAAILVIWHLGMEGRDALAEVLVGEHAPSGKLPMTFPRSMGQIPIAYNPLPTSRPPGEDRYTSRYLDELVTPLYPFGWGLGYSTYEYSDIAVGAASMTTTGAIDVEVTVRNAGRHPGWETVQLYTRQLVASRSRPIRELKGFTKVWLEGGQAKRVRLRLAAKDLGYHDDDGTYIVEPGPFEVWMGGSAHADLKASFAVTP